MRSKYFSTNNIIRKRSFGEERINIVSCFFNLDICNIVSLGFSAVEVNVVSNAIVKS
jgi:hypothetical protein